MSFLSLNMWEFCCPLHDINKFPASTDNEWEAIALIKSLMKLTTNTLRKFSWMKDSGCFCCRRRYQIWHPIHFSSGCECHNIWGTEIHRRMWIQMATGFFFPLLFELCQNNHGRNVAKCDDGWKIILGVKILWYFCNHASLQRSQNSGVIWSMTQCLLFSREKLIKSLVQCINMVNVILYFIINIIIFIT